jgi:hypothetical protein
VESGMSISIAIIGIDGIVLATDDRTVLTGSGIQKHRDGSQKMWILQDRYGGMSVNMNAGSSDWIIENFMDSLERPERYWDTDKLELMKIDDYRRLVSYSASYLMAMCKPFAFDKEQMQSGSSFSFGFTLAGYQSTEPQIHWLHSSQLFFPSLRRDYCIGGISSVGEYYIQKLWGYLFENRDNMINPLKNKNILKRLAYLIGIETHKNNNGVSDNITLKVVASNGIESVNEAEIKDIKKEVNKITDDIKLMKLLSKEK